MTTSSIVKAADIDLTKFNFSPTIKTNKFQGKSVFASYRGGSLRVQLPKMGLPFGISKYANPESGDIKYSLDMSMKDVDPAVLENFEAIEEHVLNYVEKNSLELFKKKRTKAILKEFYKPFIKYHEEDGERSDKYPPRFKSKLWTTGNDFSVDVYDSVKVDGKYPKIKMTLDNEGDVITPGSQCEAIIQCSGLWVVGDGFGISWSVVQIKSYKNDNAIVGYAFQDEEEEVEEEVAEEVEAIEEDVEEEFNEADLDVSVKFDEPVATPAPVAAKRSRRKKEDL